MSRTLSSTALQSIFAQETDEVWITLLEISHPDLASDLYISSDPTTTLGSGEYGTTSNSQDYTFLPFSLTLAPQNENLIARARLTIDNVSRDLIAAVIEASNSPPVVNIKIVLASDPDTVEFQFLSLNMNNVNADATTLEADLFPKILQGEAFPSESFTFADFPGLYGGL